MEKKLLIIFLTAILVLIFFNADFCLALNDPTNLDVYNIGQGTATFKWEFSGGDGEIDYFLLLYKDTNPNVDQWESIWPTKDMRAITFRGFDENTTYEWQIQAIAIDTNYNSNSVNGPEFTTTQAPVPPPPPDNNGGGMGPITLKNPLDQESLWDAIDAVLNFLILVSFAIAPILIIYSAFLMIFAGGDATKLNRARTIISWTLIALAVILSAKVLPSVIKGAFGG